MALALRESSRIKREGGVDSGEWLVGSQTQSNRVQPRGSEIMITITIKKDGRGERNPAQSNRVKPEKAV
jgi:hypothetical protein